MLLQFPSDSFLVNFIVVTVFSLIYFSFKYLTKKSYGVRVAKNEDELLKIKYLKEQFENEVPSIEVDYDKYGIFYDSISIEIAPSNSSYQPWKVIISYVHHDSNQSSIFDIGKDEYSRKEEIFSISDKDLEKAIQNKTKLSIILDVIINGSGQISQFNNFGFKLSIPKPKLLSLLQIENNNHNSNVSFAYENTQFYNNFDGVYYAKNVKEAIEIIKEYSDNECVIVERFGDLTISENNSIIEKINIQTINSSEINNELNKSYLKKCVIDDWSLISEEETQSILSKIDIENEAKAEGFDIYDIKNFNLDLEFQIGY